jgi:hypothetical protein
MRSVALTALLLLSACGGSSGDGEPTIADECSKAGATSIPASCVPGEGGPFDAIPSQSGAPPSRAADIPPVTTPPLEGELARGGNDTDASLTTRTFTVTLPAGQRLRTTLACQGAPTVVLKTTPKSRAEQEFACGYQAPAELTVEDSVPVSRPTTFSVTVTADGPARWYVVISGTSAPVPQG